jgi:hypothetical protein
MIQYSHKAEELWEQVCQMNKGQRASEVGRIDRLIGELVKKVREAERDRCGSKERGRMIALIEKGGASLKCTGNEPHPWRVITWRGSFCDGFEMSAVREVISALRDKQLTDIIGSLEGLMSMFEKDRKLIGQIRRQGYIWRNLVIIQGKRREVNEHF